LLCRAKNFMPLKRKESLKEGLQRISERRLQGVLQMIAHEGPTAESVHKARKIVKSLRATLRLTRGALSTEARNQVLRDFAGKFSGPRDAAVTLNTFEKVYPDSLNGERHPKARPRWATEVQQSLMVRAHATLPAESYRDAVRGTLPQRATVAFRARWEPRETLPTSGRRRL
jgi:CHAD domain